MSTRRPTPGVPKARRNWWLPMVVALASCNVEPPNRPRTPPGTSNQWQKDLHELVLQPRRGWTPEDRPYKLSLMLIAEKTGILKGEGFGYRLEIRNVGQKPVLFKEASPSFIKDGAPCAPHGFRFYVTPPSGRERELECLPKPAEKPLEGGLDLPLLPGEFLLTRRGGPSSPFRLLATPFRFDQPGRYRLRAVYVRGALRAESKTVSLDVFR